MAGLTTLTNDSTDFPPGKFQGQGEDNLAEMVLMSTIGVLLRNLGTE
jgi:hypothetical protein